MGFSSGVVIVAIRCVLRYEIQQNMGDQVNSAGAPTVCEEIAIQNRFIVSYNDFFLQN